MDKHDSVQLTKEQRYRPFGSTTSVQTAVASQSQRIGQQIESKRQAAQHRRRRKKMERSKWASTVKLRTDVPSAVRDVTEDVADKKRTTGGMDKEAFLARLEALLWPPMDMRSASIHAQTAARALCAWYGVEMEAWCHAGMEQHAEWMNRSDAVPAHVLDAWWELLRSMHTEHITHVQYHLMHREMDEEMRWSDGADEEERMEDLFVRDVEDVWRAAPPSILAALGQRCFANVQEESAEEEEACMEAWIAVWIYVRDVRVLVDSIVSTLTSSDVFREDVSDLMVVATKWMQYLCEGVLDKQWDTLVGVWRRAFFRDSITPDVDDAEEAALFGPSVERFRGVYARASESQRRAWMVWWASCVMENTADATHTFVAWFDMQVGCRAVEWTVLPGSVSPVAPVSSAAWDMWLWWMGQHMQRVEWTEAWSGHEAPTGYWKARWVQLNDKMFEKLNVPWKGVVAHVPTIDVGVTWRFPALRAIFSEWEDMWMEERLPPAYVEAWFGCVTLWMDRIVCAWTACCAEPDRATVLRMEGVDHWIWHAARMWWNALPALESLSRATYTISMTTAVSWTLHKAVLHSTAFLDCSREEVESTMLVAWEAWGWVYGFAVQPHVSAFALAYMDPQRAHDYEIADDDELPLTWEQAVQTWRSVAAGVESEDVYAQSRVVDAPNAHWTAAMRLTHSYATSKPQAGMTRIYCSPPTVLYDEASRWFRVCARERLHCMHNTLKWNYREHWSTVWVTLDTLNAWSIVWDMWSTTWPATVDVLRHSYKCIMHPAIHHEWCAWMGEHVVAPMMHVAPMWMEFLQGLTPLCSVDEYVPHLVWMVWSLYWSVNDALKNQTIEFTTHGKTGVWVEAGALPGGVGHMWAKQWDAYDREHLEKGVQQLAHGAAACEDMDDNLEEDALWVALGMLVQYTASSMQDVYLHVVARALMRRASLDRDCGADMRRWWTSTFRPNPRLSADLLAQTEPSVARAASEAWMSATRERRYEVVSTDVADALRESMMALYPNQRSTMRRWVMLWDVYTYTCRVDAEEWDTVIHHNLQTVAQTGMAHDSTWSYMFTWDVRGTVPDSYAYNPQDGTPFPPMMCWNMSEERTAYAKLLELRSEAIAGMSATRLDLLDAMMQKLAGTDGVMERNSAVIWVTKSRADRSEPDLCEDDDLDQEEEEVGVGHDGTFLFPSVRSGKPSTVLSGRTWSVPSFADCQGLVQEEDEDGMDSYGCKRDGGGGGFMEDE
jgi:hypothetical protein